MISRHDIGFGSLYPTRLGDHIDQRWERRRIKHCLNIYNDCDKCSYCIMLFFNRLRLKTKTLTTRR